MKEIIIIPDVHGRTFWKDVINKYGNNPDSHIIFLGDYLDPYIRLDNITPQEAFINFKEIVREAQLKNNITLLIGNHDLHYFPLFLDYLGCRKDNLLKNDISDLFVTNKNLFKVAYEITIKNKRFLFTHAGIIPSWFDYITDKFPHKLFSKTYDQQPINIELTADGLNSLLNSEEGLRSLSIVSRERGGRALTGSPLWADVSEHYYSSDSYNDSIYQIFGHSLAFPTLDDYVINDCWAMLDCRKAFKLDCETLKINELC